MSLVRSAIQQIGQQKRLGWLNAFISRLKEESILEQVRVAECSAASTGKICGRLIAVKDNICTTTLPTTAGSGILEDFRSPYAASVVERIESHGGVVVGKTNMDEFGMGSHSLHSHFGPVKQGGNERDFLSAGGSSGGSAVAVATGQCWAAIGTDTGGSVRLPAAYNGVVGFKPTYGLISRWGVIAYANSLDTVGIIAGTVSDVKNVFSTIAVFDARDPTSVSDTLRAGVDPARLSEEEGRSLRIGVPLEYNIEELSPDVRSAWLQTVQMLEAKGHSIKAVSLPATKKALSAYYVIAPAEASSNLAKYDGVRYGARSTSADSSGGVLFSSTRSSGFGDEVRRRIVLGAYTLSSEAIENYFIQAQKVRRLVQQDFNRVFSRAHPFGEDSSATQPDEVDLLLCPTVPGPPPSFAAVQDQLGVREYMNDVFTVPASLAGLPAVSVPSRLGHACTSDGLRWPVSMQIIGQFGDDASVLRLASIVEGLE